eukprot:CAMPEP_0119318884 /NCGR_PEP_ID=MMETSP1333-20130426/47898_1 /TAXON_ID=418940 /ORGANISM="Scyphosphaera apsteinii, Strain RCC1455" /LENGTH=559 /DNA_ID=CAMNT_0007325185 /DNA_START=54 /DNA_END=1734 /DNA_ORIENTATION=-
MLADLTTRALFDRLCNPETCKEIKSAITEASSNITLTPTKRGQIVAALWASKERDFLRKLLLERPAFSEAGPLARAVSLLDTPRKIKALEHKLANSRARKLGKIREKLHALQSEGVPQAFSLTRSFTALLKKLLSAIPAARLEFDLLFFQDGPWRDFCDLAHMKPRDWSVSYFQNTVFGLPPPRGSLLADMHELNQENLPAVIERHPQLAECYSAVRLRLPTLDNDCRLCLASKVPLADALWHYEELASAEAERAISARLDKGESLAGGHLSTDNFAKLLDRLLIFRKRGVSFWPKLMPLAEQMLEELKGRRLALIRGPRSLQEIAASAVNAQAATAAVPEAVAMSVPCDTSLFPRVAVLGDASASMQVCVEASSICGAMMAAIFDAELLFFNSKAFKARCHEMPRSAKDVLEVTEEVRASNQTSPAAALHRFFSQETERAVDLFIVVTDEVENTKCEGHYFASLFELYLRDVNAQAKCIFVSFLSCAAHDGQMVSALKARGIVTPQFKFDQRRADLSKFDSLLGLVLLEASKSLDAAKQQLGCQHSPIDVAVITLFFV